MKIISFSLWGQNPKYTFGAIKNAELAKEIYPEWICRFYVGQSTPSPIVYQLEEMDNVQVVHRPEFGDWRGMFWRFLPASEPEVEAMISRDADSRVNYREQAAVEEWLKSDKGFHIMRDHPYHGYPILGGMWGTKANIVPGMKKMIDGFSQVDAYGTDYKFLAEMIFPSLNSENIMVHDEFFDGGQPFPTKREGLQFVGQVFDENEKTIEEHDQALKNAL